MVAVGVDLDSDPEYVWFQNQHHRKCKWISDTELKAYVILGCKIYSSVTQKLKPDEQIMNKTRKGGRFVDSTNTDFSYCRQDLSTNFYWQVKNLSLGLLWPHLPNFTDAMACAASPSLRPTNPSASVVVALTLTRVTGSSQSCATLSLMASRWGLILGCSQISVTSTCWSEPWFSLSFSIANLRNLSLEAPFHFGSVGGKWSLNIAQTGRAQYGVCEGMQSSVCVWVTLEGVPTGNGYTTEPQRGTVRLLVKLVNVKPRTSSDVRFFHLALFFNMHNLQEQNTFEFLESFSANVNVDPC